MTEHQDNTSNTGPAPTETSEIASPGTSGTPKLQNGSEAPKVNKEARYRVERNQAREALTAAEARIAGFQRAEIERIAGDRLAMPGDLFSLSGNELADYLTDDGDVDADKVAADVAAVLAERPGLGKRPLHYDPSQGHGGKPSSKQAPSWGALFKETGRS